MSSRVKIFYAGLHRGEERLIVGNRKAGMVNFSGCHLACSFCYTPETSVHKVGEMIDSHGFRAVLDKLALAGAQNINLISPTHVWSSIEKGLEGFHQSAKLPVVLKVSGYEAPGLIGRMARLTDVFVPDFKVFSKAAAESVNLPKDYGQVALRALEQMQSSFAPVLSDEGLMVRGVLVRHLLMPGYLQDSLEVVNALRTIRFNGYLNLMTHFFNPQNGQLKQIPFDQLQQVLEFSKGGSFEVLVDGKCLERKDVAA